MVGILFLGAAGASAHAQPAADAPTNAGALTGEWQLDRAASDDVKTAIDRAVRPMNAVVRLVARRRLTALNQPFPGVRVARRGADTVAITWGAGPVVRAVPDAGAAPFVNIDGERMSVRMTTSPAEGGVLAEVYDASDGTRTNRWELLGDGRVAVHVRVAGPRLAEPLRYRLVYQRAERRP